MEYVDEIIAELVKHGWGVDPRDNSNVVIARLPVQTFRGVDFAKVHSPTVSEEGAVSVRAEFISKGENALAFCCVYIDSKDEIPVKTAQFNTEILKNLSQAFSVRMAS